MRWATCPLPCRPSCCACCRAPFERVGGRRPSSDVRVIAASNRNLHRLVQEGKFREDLYFRLNVVKIELRRCANGRRRSPVGDAFYPEVRSSRGRSQVDRSGGDGPAAAVPLARNIRELENAIERACVTRGAMIRRRTSGRDPDAAPPNSTSESICPTAPEQLAEVTASLRSAICQSVAQSAGHIGRASRITACRGGASRTRSPDIKSTRRVKAE